MMKILRLPVPFWLLPVAIMAETALCAVMAAALLDVFVHRPQVGGGSVTTLLPGFVYASATVMKVCLVSAVVSGVAGLVWCLVARRPSMPLHSGLPVWGIASIVLTPATPFVGSLAVLVMQSLVSFSLVAPTAVFVMLAMILGGVLAAVVSFVRGERPGMLPMLGLVANVVLVGLFYHLRFYALGFDQDTWAPR